MKRLKKQIPLYTVLFICSFMLFSCYSVRLVSTEGTPQPDPFSERDDKYKNIQVVEKDTVIGINLLSKSFDFLVKKNSLCKSGKLHSVEYRNTFGGVLLSAITFGKRRKMKVIYVCMKKER